MKRVLLLAVAVCLAACSSDTRLFQQAKQAVAKGNYTKALSLYNKLLKQNPQHAAALTNRGLLWEMMPAKNTAEKAKNRGFAENDYLRALELNPDSAEAYNNLGALYLDMNHNADAAGYFTEALLRNPSYFTALVNRGVAYSRLGQLSKALLDFSRAQELRPHDASLLLNRGLAYMDAEKYEQAVDDFSHALVTQPDNARLYLERARAYTKMGYPADAYDDLSEAITLKPSYALAYYYLGDLMFRNGDKDYALGALIRAKELAYQYVPTYDLMGDMLAMEDPVSATANYLVAAKLDPQHAAKYRRKIEQMKTEEGRYQVMSARFFPQGRAYNAEGQRFAARPIPTVVQAQRVSAGGQNTRRSARRAGR